MEVLDLTLSGADADLAFDEALLRRLDDEAGGGECPREWLRFWESRRPVVVLGRSCRVVEDVDVGACAAAGVPVLRRISGGGTVVLGPGCLNFTLVLAYAGRAALRDVAGSYGLILRRIARAIRLPGLRARGLADLAWDGRKVSGNAQLRGRQGLLHHGTLLHSFDPALPSRFLREPHRQPRYRAHRVHADFIGNLPFSAETLKARLAEAWHGY